MLSGGKLRRDLKVHVGGGGLKDKTGGKSTINSGAEPPMRNLLEKSQPPKNKSSHLKEKEPLFKTEPVCQGKGTRSWGEKPCPKKDANTCLVDL